MGVDVAYDHFEKASSLPLLFILMKSKALLLIQKFTQKKRNIRIELYTETKDLTIEEKLENFIEDNFRKYLQMTKLFI